MKIYAANERMTKTKFLISGISQYNREIQIILRNLTVNESLMQNVLKDRIFFKKQNS